MKHRRERWKKASPKKGKIWGGVAIGFMLLMIILASGGTAYAYGYYQSQLPLLQGLANQQTSQTTHIYDVMVCSSTICMIRVQAVDAVLPLPINIFRRSCRTL